MGGELIAEVRSITSDRGVSRSSEALNIVCVRLALSSLEIGFKNEANPIQSKWGVFVWS